MRAYICKYYRLASAAPRMGNGTGEETSCAACQTFVNLLPLTNRIV